MSDRVNQVHVRSGSVSLENGAVVQRRKSWLGSKEELQIPLDAITSIGVERVYSLWTLLVGLMLTSISVGVIQIGGLEVGLFAAVPAVAVLAIAAFWTSDALVVASPTAQIKARERGARSDLEAFVAEVLSEIE